MMKNVWNVQDANDRFAEMLETSLSDGPQIVTRRGVETAVLVSMEHWRGLTAHLDHHLFVCYSARPYIWD